MHFVVSDQLLGSSILAISILDFPLPLARFSFLCIVFLCTKLPYVDQLSETRNLNQVEVSDSLCESQSLSTTLAL